MEKLYVDNIFESIQGEGIKTGELTLFIRLNGCNFNCVYCDTALSIKKDKSKEMLLSDIEKEIENTSAETVCITGGEPMLQNIEPLVDVCIEHKKQVTVETNGSIFKEELMKKVSLWSLSPKLHSAKTVHWSDTNDTILKFLSNWDMYNMQIKLVVGSIRDIEDAESFYKEYYLEKLNFPFYLMPVYGVWTGKDIYKHWNYEALPKPRICIQLHKYLKII